MNTLPPASRLYPSKIPIVFVSSDDSEEINDSKTSSKRKSTVVDT